MSHLGQFIRGLFVIVLFGGIFGWIIFRSVQKAEDPARMVFKWIFTAIMLAFMIKVVGPIVGQGGYGGAFGGIPLAAVCGLALAITWRHSISALVARPFSSLYDGGDEEPVPHPAYSVAQSRQKQGKYLEAVAEVRKQLDRFPTDLEGHLMLAQILAEDLKDLPGAAMTIERLCAQPGHAPRNLTFALFSLADWHLAIGQDLEAARQAFQKVIDLVPDSEFSLSAAQRIAHLGSSEMLTAAHDRRIFAVTEGERNLGLIATPDHLKPAEVDHQRLAADYVDHLNRHPFDTDTREKLAILYADHYARLDLAADELEQMISQPHQPAKLIVHWLNLLADLQIRSGADLETVRHTLQRIVDRDPTLAAAEIARNRLARLKLELKGKEKNQAVKLGSYEQNIGLKRGLPHKL